VSSVCIKERWEGGHATLSAAKYEKLPAYWRSLLAVKITEQPGKLEPADLEKHREVGLSDAKIFYVIEVAAMYNFTNWIMSAYGMRPDDEFMAEIASRG
jgi:alkylhydroperoxidase family enzyme